MGPQDLLRPDTGQDVGASASNGGAPAVPDVREVCGVIVHFIEVSNGGNWGKFMLARLDESELALRSALPGFDEPLLTGAGLRKFNADTTMVFDLQTGEGACFTLEGTPDYEVGEAKVALDAHSIWVCPMYEPFLAWLLTQGLERGKGDITKLPRYVELEVPGAFAGYRREGSGDVPPEHPRDDEGRFT